MTIYALGEHAPHIHEDTWVAPDANLIGKVVLEQGASVWFGCTICADHEEIRIGEGSNVQENCVMHIDAGFPPDDWSKLHHWAQGDAAWLHHRRKHVGRNGRNRFERRKDRPELSDRSRDLDHRGQGNPRQFACHGIAGQGRTPAG